MNDNNRGYTIQRRERIAEAEGLRVSILTLAAGQEVPWHHHSEIDDDFFCMDGPMLVQTRQPDAAHELAPGQTLKVPAGQPHRVTGKDDGPCRFLIVQGIGVYDYVAEADAP
ncbi:MAG: cupin domain-containing protein [Alphaproteobacteria bacterium]|jgi:quercetin dioxygenase-like cupin family protein|nr:cupin domain-containing protein [Alphaproteobacteria bacterium]MDP6564581.1 cupin domain-containing protein [Alphaproteobacteria bacterium]MDP6815129.1 cupin domain-containing protein [Alphaproteobacteria bacterium]